MSLSLGGCDGARSLLYSICHFLVNIVEREVEYYTRHVCHQTVRILLANCTSSFHIRSSYSIVQRFVVVRPAVFEGMTLYITPPTYCWVLCTNCIVLVVIGTVIFFIGQAVYSTSPPVLYTLHTRGVPTL